MKTIISNDERGVSPVIGVILMVAITVILAAVIGTFVLDLGNSAVQQNPQAAVTFDQSCDTAQNDPCEVDVTVNSAQKVDSFTVKADDQAGDEDPGDDTSLGTSAGSSITFGTQGTDLSGLEVGDRVIVTASYKGNDAVIATYTIQ